MKTRYLLPVIVFFLAFGAVALLLVSFSRFAQFSPSPVLAAPLAPDDAVPVWTSQCAACYRTPGGLVARSLVTMPNGRWFFALGGDRVTLASETNAEIFVDEDVMDATDVQVSITPEGQAVLVYRDNRPDGSFLQIARPTSSGFRRETIGQSYTTFDFGSPSLVVDSLGGLHLTYIYSGNLVYLYRDGVGWHSPQQVVDSVGSWGQTSLAIDSMDQLHLAYQYQAPQTLFYLNRTDTGWSTPEQIGVGFDPQLVVDSNDRPHLISAGSNPGMQYAVLDQGSWLTETIDTAYADTGNASALVIDEQGNPHVSYYADVCGGCYQLRYAYRDSGIWHTESITAGNGKISSALGLDLNLNPYILFISDPYSQLPEGGLYTVHKTNGSWLFNDAGFPYSNPIPYTNIGTGPAMGSWQTGEEQAVFQSVITSTYSTGFASGSVDNEWPSQLFTTPFWSQPDLFVDSSGDAHIVHVRGNSLIYLRRTVAGIWTEETIHTEVNTPADPAIALDSNGLPAVAYRVSTEAFSYTIKYVERGVSGWNTPEVLISGTECARPALAFDSVGYAHVSTGCVHDMRHFYQDGAGWNWDIFSNYSIDYVDRVDLELDTDDQPLLAVIGSNGGYPVLLAAWKQENDWESRIIPAKFVPRNPINITPGGTPTMLTIDTVNFGSHQEEIFCLWDFNGSDWISSGCDRGFHETMESAFDINPDGSLYLLYYDRFRRDLRLAYRTLVEPPANVYLSGAEVGHTGQSYTFTANTSPATLAIPLVYTWESPEYAKVTYTGTLTASNAYAWDSPGAKTITVTVTNGAGSTQAVHTIQVEAPPPVAPGSVTLYCPAFAAVNESVLITASVLPLTTTSPLEYVWDATGQELVTHSRGISDTVVFEWGAPGEKEIAVSVANSVGDTAASASMQVEIPLIGTEIIVDQSPRLGLGVSFTAYSAGGTDPVYNWDFGDGVNAVGEIAEHRYAQPGIYNVTLIAANHVSQTQDTFQVTANWEVFLPLLGGPHPGQRD